MGGDRAQDHIVREIQSIESRLATLEREREELLVRLKELEALLSCSESSPRFGEPSELESRFHVDEEEKSKHECDLTTGGRPAVCVTQRSPERDKIRLFRSLFRGRDDVYPRRWESKKGKAGYSPVCRREWTRGYCHKPKVKCGDCPHREFEPLTDQVIYDHLSGKVTVGVYPLLSNENCYFLAIDFDKSSWQEDVTAFLATCERFGVPAALERSRSGNGAHVWVFFKEEIPAFTVRRLGSYLLTETMERRYEIGLDSYDRLFPGQDSLPKGGFGNLIALPLQGESRRKGNTVFLDRSLDPFADQWAYLSSIERMDPEQVNELVDEAVRQRRVVGVRAAVDDEYAEEPWTAPVGDAAFDLRIRGELPERLAIVLATMVYVPKADLPPTAINRLLRLAAFQNPEFYKAQALRLPIYNIPRLICCADDYPKHIALPRGCLSEVRELLEASGVAVEVIDKRYSGLEIDAVFQGTLTPEQEEAAGSLLAQETGILAAPTGFGKTVVGAYLVASRRVNTLIIVHRRQLLEQWREQLSAFLSLGPEEIGEIHGRKDSPTGIVDIALIQSLNRKGVVDGRVETYGQVIVDECHHLSAVSYEQVLKQVRAKYVHGLTATLVRKDGHHPIVTMQCGPVRFHLRPREQAKRRSFAHLVIPREVELQLPPQEPPAGVAIHHYYEAIVSDQARNALICKDVLWAVEEGRSPVVLTHRKEHLAILAEALSEKVSNLVILQGGMSEKERQRAAQQLKKRVGRGRVILATGSYIGEGFDDARLDTLFLTMPVSWRGVLQQYAGRLHRRHEAKAEVRIYDYVDRNVPMLVNMYKRRLAGYRSMGYEVCD